MPGLGLQLSGPERTSPPRVQSSGSHIQLMSAGGGCQTIHSPFLQALVLFLLLGSASAAAAASLTLSPYTDLAPQKIVLNQVPRRVDVR